MSNLSHILSFKATFIMPLPPGGDFHRNDNGANDNSGSVIINRVGFEPGLLLVEDLFDEDEESAGRFFISTMICSNSVSKC